MQCLEKMFKPAHFAQNLHLQALSLFWFSIDASDSVRVIRRNYSTKGGDISILIKKGKTFHPDIDIDCHDFNCMLL